MCAFQVTAEHLEKFQQDGYLIVENLLDEEQIDLFYSIAKADQAMKNDAIGRNDAEGMTTRLRIFNELQDNDIYSAITRCESIAGTMTKLLGCEIYHYHHKLMLKEPRVGGAWQWHQDYGYWYNNGCLLPDMASCFIAIDSAKKENGCLQVIKGSHKIGRINHGKIGDQTGADLDHVEIALSRMPLVYIEAEPGTACFFHGNLLHRSDQNLSDHPRWSMVCAFNSAANDPFIKHHHPNYSFLEIWPDQWIAEVGREHWERLSQVT